MQARPVKVGDVVIFGRSKGEQTRGTVTGIGRTGKLKVAQSEARGRYPVGTPWTVPASLARHEDGAPVAPPVGAPLVNVPPLPPPEAPPSLVRALEQALARIQLLENATHALEDRVRQLETELGVSS